MQGFDRRLLTYARATRPFLVGSVVIQTAQALLIVAQAFLLAGIITTVFSDGGSLADIQEQIAWFAVVVVGRSVLGFLAEWAAHRSAAAAISQLRLQGWAHAMRLGPVWLSRTPIPEVSQLLVRGLGALDTYYARYLPQLVLAVVVPIIAGAAILTQDVLATVIVALTVPLIPVFMILVGWVSQTRVDRQWRFLAVLGNHFLDVVEGLPTLKAFNRAQHQVGQIRAVGEKHRVATMGVLRITFLSSLVLELLATLSVALIAVLIGVRLVHGDMTLLAGLTVLILAPEVYLPLRMVGQHFHAAAEGADAAGRVIEILQTPAPGRGSQPLRNPDADIALEQLDLGYPDAEPVVTRLSATIPRGRITLIAGPSGAGKSTVLLALLGFLEPRSGTVRVGGQDLADVDMQQWRRQIAWVPQHPTVLPDTLRYNLTLGREHPLSAVLDRTGLAGWVQELPAGLDTPLGEGGQPVSAGQARRIALARALLQDAPIVILDEPTAGVDDRTEAEILRLLAELDSTVVVVGHRAGVADLADVVIDVGVRA